MAGPALHLAVADKMLNLIGNKISNVPLFFSGSIAPDAIQTKQGYVIDDKNYTHLRVGISGEIFSRPYNLEIFHKRVNEFIIKYYNINDIESDLYLGYIVHIITDEKFNIKIHELFEQQEEKFEFDVFFKEILKDFGSIDKRLVMEYPYTRDICTTLDIWDYEIKDFVGKDEITKAKENLLNNYWKANYKPNETVFFHYHDAIAFVNETAQEIVTMLTVETIFQK